MTAEDSAATLTMMTIGTTTAMTAGRWVTDLVGEITRAGAEAAWTKA
jgi:hypothetical protein